MRQNTKKLLTQICYCTEKLRWKKTFPGNQNILKKHASIEKTKTFQRQCTKNAFQYVFTNAVNQKLILHFFNY